MLDGVWANFYMDLYALFTLDSFSSGLIFSGDKIVTELSHELTFAPAQVPSSL